MPNHKIIKGDTMNKTFLLSALVSFVTILTLALPRSTFAVTGAYNYINETNTTYAVPGGTYTGVTTTGYPSTNKHAYQAMSRGDIINTMRWKCNSSTTTNYNYHIWIAIPSNTGKLDGGYKYYAYNTVVAENFWTPINQENYVDKWVYIGWTQGKGGKSACYVETDNVQLYSDFPREFWVDHMKYWPNQSTTPPSYDHGW
jgi:hypothetical protein